MFNLLYSTFISAVIFINVVIKPPVTKYTVNLDTIFKSWNSATLSSLENDIKMAKSEKEKNVIENSLSAFKALVDVQGGYKVNKKSIRYKFLKYIPLAENATTFYVIETISSGESVELKNYVIDQAKEILTEYQYINGSWDMSISEKISIDKDINLKSYVTSFGTGFNHDNIIITSFNNRRVVESKYFVYSTMKNLSPLNNIVKLR